MLTSAPPAMSNDTMAACPSPEATWRGVFPEKSEQSRLQPAYICLCVQSITADHRIFSDQIFENWFVNLSTQTIKLSIVCVRVCACDIVSNTHLSHEVADHWEVSLLHSMMESRPS